MDGAQVELRIVKKPFAVDTAGFVSRTEALAQLSHPSLRMVRGATMLPDGRPAAVLSLVDWIPLSACPKQATGPLLTMAIELAEGLAALHSAGLVMGVLDADDIYPGQPAVLDASLAGLAQGGDTPQEDVKMLSMALLGVVGGGKEAAPIELILKKARAESMSAEALARELNGLRTRWAARTVSGNFAALPDTIEVMEPDLTGRTLKHWKLDSVLGEGAMARVYRATDARDGSAAAVKVLKQEHVAEPEFVQRFMQEVKAVEAIHNPHIVKVTDFEDEAIGENQRVVYCVMEVLQGQALSDAMMKEAFGVVRIVKLAQQTARCLHAAHQVGIVHRDIKPENLFLTEKDGAEFVKVLDFGIAKLLKQIGDFSRVGTKAGVVVGTPEYMAPEQALGGEADARIDVYAVGLIMYELLSGEQPFKGDTFGKLVLEITQNPVPPLPPQTRAGERLPPGLSAVVLKCLEKSPEDRFANAEALAEALEPFANPKRTGDRMPAARFNEIDETAPEMTPQVTEADLAAAVKPSKVPLIVAGVVFGLLTLGAVAVWKSGGSSDQPEQVEKPANDVAPPKVAPPEEVKKVEPPPPEPPTPALPAKIKVTVTSTPSGAAIKRAGKVLGKTPFDLEFDRAEGVAPVTIELAGYTVEKRDIDLSADGKFEVTLEKASKKKKPPAKKKSKK
ncbi:MAG: serine/threonine protein kinase [Archangium sp.]|nr:serine/threonine protein kinase [Archangium sp.]